MIEAGQETGQETIALMVEGWLWDLMKRSDAEEDRWYKRSRKALELLERIQDAQEKTHVRR